MKQIANLEIYKTITTEKYTHYLIIDHKNKSAYFSNTHNKTIDKIEDIIIEGENELNE